MCYSNDETDWILVYLSNFLQQVACFEGVSSSIIGPWPSDPIEFSQVFVNQGHAWNSISNRFVIPAEGVYCIHLNVCLTANNVSKVELLLNSSAVMSYVNLTLSVNFFFLSQSSRAILFSVYTPMMSCDVVCQPRPLFSGAQRLYSHAFSCLYHFNCVACQ